MANVHVSFTFEPVGDPTKTAVTITRRNDGLYDITTVDVNGKELEKTIGTLPGALREAANRIEAQKHDAWKLLRSS